jgi:stage II sporulation protein D
MNKCKVLKTLLLLLFAFKLTANDISISLFDNYNMRSIVLSAYDGTLSLLLDNDKWYLLSDGQAIYISMQQGKIWLSNTSGHIGTYEHVLVSGLNKPTSMRLRPTSPQITPAVRDYEGTLAISVDINRLRIINKIDKQRYLAGVLEAETGLGHLSEFYKAKAIICRTYLYANAQRHSAEGFDMCDHEHCQVYRGQSRNQNIVEAVNSTNGMIIVDTQENKPILAVYHANCGGHTESAQNVWLSNIHYLLPIADTYCTSSPSARWQRSIPLRQWTDYLRNAGLTNVPSNLSNLNLQTNRRVLNYSVGGFSIPMRKIRTDWQLRSAFFSVTVEGENVILRGRGYGHGVGMCQEGAIEMAKRGLKHDEIINFYYRQTRLIYVD